MKTKTIVFGCDSFDQLVDLVRMHIENMEKQGHRILFSRVTPVTVGKLKESWREGGKTYETETYDIRYLVMLVFTEVKGNDER